MDEKQTRKNLEIPKIGPEESVVKISGFFNQKNMEDLERAFSTVDQASSRHLTIDCENLVHIDTPNIALLVGKHNEYKAQGRVLTLRSVPSSIIKILKLSRLDALLNIESEKPTVEGEERDDSPLDRITLYQTFRTVDRWSATYVDDYIDYWSDLEKKFDGTPGQK